MKRPPLLTRTLLTAVCLGFSSLCGAVELPDWPRPPTEADCRDFQTRINAIYEEADREYRACSSEPARCGSAPARRGAAAAKRATIPSCFFLANQQSSAAQVGGFLGKDKNDDVKVLGDFVKRTDEVLQRAQDLNELRLKLVNYSRLSAAEKVTLHAELVEKMNTRVNVDPLSKQLTSDALAHVTQINRSALSQLETELDKIIRNHAEHVNAGRELPSRKPPSTTSADLQKRIAALKATTGPSDRNFETVRERVAREAKAGATTVTSEEARQASELRKDTARAVCASQRTQCFDSCRGSFSSDIIVQGVRQTNCRNSCTASSDMCEGLASEDPYNIAIGKAQLEKADELNGQNLVEANRRIVERQKWQDEERRRRELYERQQLERLEASAAAEAFFSSFSQAISSYRSPIQYGGTSAPYIPPVRGYTSSMPGAPAIREGRPSGARSCPTIVCKN